MRFEPPDLRQAFAMSGFIASLLILFSIIIS
jgi:hypothetical protein